MEAGEVHQGVSGKEEVRGDHADSVELGDHDEAHSDGEHEDVAPPGVVVGIESLREPRDAGVDTILTDSLEEKRMFFSKSETELIKIYPTWRILGAPTILAMALDKLALKPPAYLGNI